MNHLKLYLQAIGQSFFSLRLYRTVVMQWRGWGEWYLLTLSALMALIIAVLFGVMLNSFTEEKLPHILEQMPVMTFKDSVLTVQGTQPKTIDVDGKYFKIYIDTTANERELREQKAMVVVGKEYLLLRSASGFEKRPFKELGLENVTVTPEVLRSKWPNPWAVAAIMAPFLVIGQFLVLGLWSLVVAVCSYVITAFMPEEYPFETRMRIAAVAMTPPLILSRVMSFCGHFTGNWFDLALSLFYFYIIVIATRQKVATTA